MIVGGGCTLCVGEDSGGIGWALGEEKKRKSKKENQKSAVNQKIANKIVNKFKNRELMQVV